MPLLLACYVLSFLDKTLLNYSSIFGLQKALQLHGTQYSWCSSVFYFVYLLGQPLSGRLIQRFPQHVAKIVTGSVLLWSIVVLLTPLCKNFGGLAANRFFLGVLEAPIAPAFVFMTSHWYSRSEKSLWTAIWFCGTPIGNFFGGVLGYGLGSIHSPHLASWQIFFLFFGALSFAWAFVLAFFLPDSQHNARFLNKTQKLIAVERVRANQNVTLDWKWAQVKEGCFDFQIGLFVLITFSVTLPSNAASSFSSLIVKGFGFTPVQTTLISACPAACLQILWVSGSGLLASRRANLRLYLAVVTSVPPLIGAGLLHSLPVSNTCGRLAGYYLTFSHNAAYVVVLALTAGNVAGATKKKSDRWWSLFLTALL